MTKRNKWLIGIGLVVLFVILDIIVGTSTANHARQEESVYRTALKTRDSTRFNYIVKSRQGNVITHTKITGTEPVKFHEMTNKHRFLTVKRVLEIYTMHTRTVTDSKGNTHTETYWTWDYAGSHKVASTKVKIFGHRYDVDRFDLSEFYQSIDADKIIDHGTGLIGKYYYLNGDERYRYEIIPMSVNGSFIANTSKGTLSPTTGNKIEVSKEHYRDYLHHHVNGETRKVITTVVLLVLVEIIFTAVFYCEDFSDCIRRP